MKKISPRELNLLLILSGVLVFVVLYTYLFTPLQSKVSSMKFDIESIEREIKELEIHSAYADTYQEKTAEYKANIDEKLSAFPADIKEEDIIAYLLKLEEASGVDISSISFTPAQQVTSFQGIVNQKVEIDMDSDEENAELEKLRQENQKEVVTNMQVFSTGASIAAELSYDELKDTINYIYNGPSQATLDTVSISYNSETKKLNGSMNILRYYIAYPEAVYTPEQLPQVSIGVDQLFGD